ncbi:type VI secretion system-associated protein TagF [Aquabacterium parvum]|uniref:type VI secretion system-associated protein TagF n=1 Tax=Aquabacterium parvum TaxID=70584 RepID=UPI000718AD12|nr:type VI secretion system-associated protein TagF [Aquabacterium parvum]MBU0917437.1 type VI secretion system-associated protein TagF [Gammaproteobacteria bacterium]
MITTESKPVDVLYFGKLPSRGDFVRSAQHPAMLEVLDRWQAQTLERMSTDPRWKLIYDEAPALAFAILGSGSHVALAGHWLASQDTSGRRFPFVTAGAFDLRKPQQSAVLAPIALDALWHQLATRGQAARRAADLGDVQARLQAPLEHVPDFEEARDRLESFLDAHSLASLGQILSAGGRRLSVRQAVLALGLLLRPALVQGGARMNKLLCLPLPLEPSLRACVASWWLMLIMGFFTRHVVEFSIFLPVREGLPQMLLGFQGASAASLEAVIDPSVLSRHGVTLGELDWVEDEAQADVGLRKLSTYLQDPALSLTQAVRTFQEVFLGA